MGFELREADYRHTNMDMLKYAKSKLSVLLKRPYINALRGVPLPNFQGNAAQVEIARVLELEGGKLIARVGETEGRATAFYLTQRLAKGPERASYPETLRSALKLQAGFFPATADGIDDLAGLYVRSIEAIDLYAAWTPHDRILKPRKTSTTRLIDLDPFFTEKKWSLALADKRVCIVSPFVDSIQRQFDLRDKIFPEPTLPAFDLQLARAPMTHCESDVIGQSWIDNKNRLTESVMQTRPDIVIIGAGAYGLPVGYDLKKEGLKAIVMGGATQLLFGLKGKRWELDRQYRKLMNEYWVRPDNTERPPGFQNLEINGGAYW